MAGAEDEHRELEGRRAVATEQKLPRAVVGLGLVSLLTDTSSEAIFPLLPAFLAVLGASNAFIGLAGSGDVPIGRSRGPAPRGATPSTPHDRRGAAPGVTTPP